MLPVECHLRAGQWLTCGIKDRAGDGDAGFEGVSYRFILQGGKIGNGLHREMVDVNMLIVPDRNGEKRRRWEVGRRTVDIVGFVFDLDGKIIEMPRAIGGGRNFLVGKIGPIGQLEMKHFFYVDLHVRPLTGFPASSMILPSMRMPASI